MRKHRMDREKGIFSTFLSAALIAAALLAAPFEANAGRSTARTSAN
jgi:hypothetical protein